MEIFRKEPEDKLENILIGNSLCQYIGHSTNHNIRYNSSSGGMVTQLLIFALEKGVIDGSLATRMRKDRPLEPEPFIARTREQIIEASKSKYCPVPANIAIKEILKENGKFAVVGLPCHIQGIRKAETLNKKLREKVILHFGLFCEHTINFLGTEFILQRINIRREDVLKIDYRGRGWPGGMTIKYKNGKEKIISFHDFCDLAHGSFFFTPLRCTVCSDGTSEFADVSFGDAWLPELKDNKVGESIVISRTEIGDEILQKATSNGKIEIIKIGMEKVLESQEGLRYKKKNIEARRFILKLLGSNVPEDNPKLLKPSILAYIPAALIYLNLYVSSEKHLRNLLRYVPWPILKGYSRFTHVLNKRL